MSEKLPLELRNGAQEVTVIVPEGGTRPVLGTSDPAERGRRQKVVRQWGQAPSPRAQRLAGIEQPLDQRSQTILSHEVGAGLRARLNGGMGSLAQQRGQGAPESVRRVRPGGRDDEA